MFCWTVRPHANPRPDHPGHTTHNRTILVQPPTIWPGRGLYGPSRVNRPGLRTQNQELHNMRSPRTHRNLTTVPHRQHIITMTCHFMRTGLNILQPPESPRDIGQEVVALIGHLTHISNIPRRKADRMMSGNLRFPPTNLMDSHQTWWKRLGMRYPGCSETNSVLVCQA
jgi:hypothetical protein